MADNNAYKRLLDGQQARLEAQRERFANDRRTAAQTAYYAGGGQYQQAGGDGGYRPRGVATSGGTPLGQRVPSNGGIVGGMPAGQQPQDTRELEALIAETAYARGPQIGTTDPQGATPPTPRYPQDLYYYTTTGVLFLYDITEDIWTPVAGATEALPFRIEADVVEETTYILDAYQHYAVEVVALEGVSGATVTVSPAVGNTAAIGSAISITVSALPDPAVTVVGSILLRRV